MDVRRPSMVSHSGGADNPVPEAGISYACIKFSTLRQMAVMLSSLYLIKHVVSPYCHTNTLLTSHKTVQLVTDIIDSRYIAAIHSTIVHIVQQLQYQNFGQILHLRTTPHTSPLWARYEMSSVSYPKKMTATTIPHYSEITWTPGRLILPPSRLYVQQIVLLTAEKTPKWSHKGPVMRKAFPCYDGDMLPVSLICRQTFLTRSLSYNTLQRIFMTTSWHMNASHYGHFVRRIHRGLLCIEVFFVVVYIGCWNNSRVAEDLRRHDAHVASLWHWIRTKYRDWYLYGQGDLAIYAFRRNRKYPAPDYLITGYLRCLRLQWHYNDVIMGAIASQITSLTIVYSTVYPDADQRKHQSSASLAFVSGIHRWPVNSPQNGQ